MSKIETVEQLKEVDKIIVVTKDFFVFVEGVCNRLEEDAGNVVLWCNTGLYLDIEENLLSDWYRKEEYVAETYTYSDKLFKDLSKLFKKYEKVHKQVNKDREQELFKRLQKEI